MPKKAKPRTLGAEPLEERLPVSSSAAGVLFGLGLANDTTTAAYEAPQTLRSESVSQQTTLIDLTLDLQLDALAVDLFHAEESLLDTISPATPDPFVLTPLTPSVVWNDTTTDAYRELGDELLLFQISTLDFTQVSFGPVTPERFEPVMPQQKSTELTFEDALTPPDDLTAYGYSPVANDLEKEDGSGGPQMSCGCGCVNTPYIASLKISGCGCALTASRCSASSGLIFNYSDKTFYTISNSVTVQMSGVNGTSSITVLNDTSGLLVKGAGTVGTGVTYTWVVPAGTPKFQAQNVFTFEFQCGTDVTTANVHFGWAEVLVDFAGSGVYGYTSTANSQNSSNTVVVGQEVHAKIATDSAFPVVNNTYTWSAPTGGMFVKNYEADETAGVITYHDTNDYKASEFKHYYISKSSNTGGIGCSFIVQDPRGFMHNAAAGSSYYIETPVCNSFTSTWANWGNGKPSVDVRKNWADDGNADALSLGGIETVNGVGVEKAGIEWTVNCSANTYTSSGFFGFVQLVASHTTQKIGASTTDITNTNNQFVLDGYPHATSLGNGTSVSDDSPCIYLQDTVVNGEPTPTSVSSNASQVSRQDSFTTYFCYLPEGKKTICVTLAMMNWGWSGTATKNSSGQWTCTGRSTWGGQGTYPVTVLPTWTSNISQY